MLKKLPIVLILIIALALQANAQFGLGGSDSKTGKFYFSAYCIPELLPLSPTVDLGWMEIKSTTAEYDLRTPPTTGQGIPMKFALYGQQTGTSSYTISSVQWDKVSLGSGGNVKLESHWEIKDLTHQVNPIVIPGTSSSFSQSGIQLIPDPLGIPCDSYAEIICYADVVTIEPAASPAQWVFTMRITATFDAL